MPVSPTLWRIEMFGGLRAISGERTITRFRTQKTASVLAYLALHLERPQAREVVRELIWPDEPFEASSNALRVALNSLRKQLEPPGTLPRGVLLADRNNIQLSAACETDVAQFTERLRAARAMANNDSAAVDALRDAVALYQGDLLPGFFGDWAIAERERLTQACLGALLDLTRYRTDAGDYPGAAEYARRAVQIVPLSEEAYRALMRAHASGGDAAGAYGQYERLTRLLRAELDIAPSAETRTLAARLDKIAAAAPRKSGPLPQAAKAAPPILLAPPTQPTPAASGAGEVPLAPAASLPYPFTRFFGRVVEKERLCALLAAPSPSTGEDTPAAAGTLPGDRQVTLTGAGGVGKTRLAVEVGRALAADYGQFVFYVALGDEMDARRIGERIADVLRLPRQPSGDYGDALATALNRRPTLLILDNFEQLAPGGGPLVPALLKAVPTLRLLVTSRRRLEVPGERVVALAALPTPPLTADAPDEDLTAYPSVTLFLDRAQTTLPDFTLTPRTAGDLAAVCRALEGSPLAIELAAARVRALSLTQMREQIAGERLSPGQTHPSRFPLLASRRADDPDRHHSLWATIDWSYSLLPPPLRRFFRNLAVFRGGWTLEAAQAVCDEPYALEYLTQLRAHSLIVAEESFPALRFHLLDSLREFAEAQTDDGERDTYAARHLAFFTRLADAAQEGLRGATQRAWLDRLDADDPNLRIALARCAARATRDAAAGEAGLRVAGLLFPYWMLRGALPESAEIVVGLLARAPAEDAPIDALNARALASNTAGALFVRIGDYEQARRYLDESLALYRVTGDQAGWARVRSNQGTLLGRLGDGEAGRAAQSESLAIRLAIGDRWGAAASYLNLGAAAHNTGDLPAAATAYEESLRISREIDDARGAGAALLNLANLAVATGDTEQALRRYAEVLVVARAQGIPVNTALVLFNRGGLLLETGAVEAAETNLDESLALCRKIGDGPLAGATLVELGRAATRRGAFDLARSRLAESLALPLTHAVTVAALEVFYELANTQEQWEHATVLCAAAIALRAQFHLLRSAGLIAAQDVLLSELRAKLGPETFTARWNEGTSLTLEQAREAALRAP